MKEPLKAGDLCHVVSGMLGSASPNIGLVVKVLYFVYDCPKYGQVWRCDAEYAQRGPSTVPSLVPTQYTDFAKSWLKKIEPPLPKLKTKEKETVHE